MVGVWGGGGWGGGACDVRGLDVVSVPLCNESLSLVRARLRGHPFFGHRFAFSLAPPESLALSPSPPKATPPR